MTAPAGSAPARRAEDGRTILVARVGAAPGARAAAAALACIASEVDRPALLIELGTRAPRPSLIATAAARVLEERLAAHVDGADVASRGRLCHLALPPDAEGVASIGAALPIVRDSTAVLHLPPHLVQPLLAEEGFRPSSALLRADLDRDRALTALAAHELMERGVAVAVLKQPLSWLASRSALLGALPSGSRPLPPRLSERLLR